MKIKALIIDNEIEDSHSISSFINKYASKKISIISKAYNINDALALYTNNTPDIVFLDVNLKNENVFDFITNIKNPHQITVIVSDNPEYALKAYEANVNAYLAKPISIDRFNEMITQTTELIKLKKTSSGKLMIKDNNKESHILDATDIVKLKSIGKGITEIYVGKKVITCNKSIGVVEKKLDSKIFFRISWGTSINTLYVLKANLDKNIVFLKNDTTETISFRRKKMFKAFITKQ